jgi:hypothetical protein
VLIYANKSYPQPQGEVTGVEKNQMSQFWWKGFKEGYIEKWYYTL